MSTSEELSVPDERLIVSTVPLCECPWCEAPLDSAAGPEDQPEPGDVSVCVECASPVVFDENLRLRQLRQAELNALDPDVRQTIEAMMFACRTLGPPERD